MEMLAGNGGQAEKIFPLPNPDNDAYARRESDDHGRGNKSDDRAHACQTEQQQNNAGHKGGNLQAVDAMLSDDTCQNNNEGARGSGDLHPASAQQRNGRSEEHTSELQSLM